MNKLDFPIAVVCHDAGAANHIISWIKAEKSLDIRPAMFGPAKQIWEREFLNRINYETVEAALSGAHSLLSGTGWQTSVEHMARKMAHQAGIKSIAVLDHWVNYKERFQWENEIIYPEEFWVVDQFAVEIAKKTFPENTVRLLPNLYLDGLIKKISKNLNAAPDILYVLEPMRSNWGYFEQGEFQALNFFCSKLDQIPILRGKDIRMRLHPSEEPGKYSEWLSRHSKFNIKIDEFSSLCDSISKADCVVGCQSYALVVALHAGRKVYTSLPKNAPAFRLPYRDIIELRNL